MNIRVQAVASGLMLVLMLSVLLSCELLLPAGEEESEYEWVMMVYLDGDNNLEGAGVEDFHEMEKGLYDMAQIDGDIRDSFRILVLFDDETITAQGIYDVMPYNVDLTSNAQMSAAPSRGLLADTSTEVNMGDAATLDAFIDFVKARYDSKNYALVLWNHGGGVRSEESPSPSSRTICWDDSSGDVLYSGEVRNVVSNENSVDLLAMDACLMGMVEVAYQFRPSNSKFSAEAMAFSPATEQGDGYEYNLLLPQLITGRTIAQLTANAFADEIVDAYRAAFSSVSGETQTAVDLTKIVAVKRAVDDLASLLSGYEATMLGSGGVQDNTYAYFDTTIADEWKEYAGFDLYDLAYQTKSAISNAAVDDACDDLMDAVSAAVIDSTLGNSGGGYLPGSHGLSIFFPYGDGAYGGYAYWDYQYFYTSLSHTNLATWYDDVWGGADYYGEIEFCSADNDNTVESWFELLQYWFNPTKDPSVHPGPYY
ncbi:MAG: hypothetical protein JXK93_07630 [Sphaerochaetaceae bacterium]|nr:hypothetical protein [Sphaerochaetaceae bacterium]